MRLHWFGRLTVAAALGAAGCSLLVDSPSDSGDSCLEHSDCETGVCDRARASCLPEEKIIYLDGSGVDDAGCGSRAQPCRRPAVALERLSATRRTLLLGSGDFERFVVDGGQAPDRILVVGSSETRLVGAAPIVQVMAGGSLALEDLVVTGANDPEQVRAAVECLEPSVIEMRHVAVFGNAWLAISANACVLLSIESSTIHDNSQGIYISRTPFEIVNNFIVNNGYPDGLFAAVHIVSNDLGGLAPGRFEFNTLAQHQATNAWGVHCETTNQTMSNNIVVSTLDDGPPVSGNCSWAYSNIQLATGIQDGPGNMNSPALFVDPFDDFHLRPDSPCRDSADPDTAIEDAIAVDFEGDPRPAGAAADIGADEAN